MRKNENKQERRNKGFTLVELIIVIAILAVIAAIAAPNLVGNIGKARRTADVASAKVIGDAVVLTLVQDSKFDGETLTLDVIDDSAADGTFIKAIADNLQSIPTPKADDGNVFVVTVDASGKVEVFTSTAADTAGVKLYPVPEGKFAD